MRNVSDRGTVVAFRRGYQDVESVLIDDSGGPGSRGDLADKESGDGVLIRVVFVEWRRAVGLVDTVRDQKGVEDGD